MTNPGTSLQLPVLPPPPPHSRSGHWSDSLAQSSGRSEAHHHRVPGSVLKMKPICHSKPCLTSHLTYEKLRPEGRKDLAKTAQWVQGPGPSDLNSTPPYVPMCCASKSPWEDELTGHLLHVHADTARQLATEVKRGV